MLLCSSVPSSALASPEFEGRGGEELGHHMAHLLSQAYQHHSAIDREGLCIIPGQQCWILYVDVLVRSDFVACMLHARYTYTAQ